MSGLSTGTQERVKACTYRALVWIGDVDDVGVFFNVRVVLRSPEAICAQSVVENGLIIYFGYAPVEVAARLVEWIEVWLEFRAVWLDFQIEDKEARTCVSVEFIVVLVYISRELITLFLTLEVAVVFHGKLGGARQSYKCDRKESEA